MAAFVTAIRLGCQGWTYPDWVGIFYPPGAKQEHLLPFYSQVFSTVELDNTFYRTPKPTLVRSWARHTPKEFRFAAKVPREITHESGLKGVDAELAEFVRVMEGMEEKLGPLLLQMPASFQNTRETREDLIRFLDHAPSGVRMAIEFRDASWHETEIFDLLREKRVAVAWTQWRTLNRVQVVTTDFLYLRWLGNRSDIEKYDRVQIDRGADFEDWQTALEKAAPEVENMYGYFNNHWAGHSPASVNELLKRLGEATVDPQGFWPQGELF